MSSTSVVPPPMSRKALAGFLLSLLSLCLGLWAGLPALALGVAGAVLAALAVRDIRRHPGGLQGKGFAVVGIGGACLSGLAVLVVLPGIEHVRTTANRMKSQ